MLMSRTILTSAVALVIGCTSLIASLTIPVARGASAAMASTKNPTKMVRVGRFGISLPKDAVFDGALLELNGVPVAIGGAPEAGAKNMTTDKKTFYFGRYSIAIPTNGSDIWSSYEVVKKKIEFISKNGRRDLPKSTAETIATITRKHNAGYIDEYDHTLPLDGGGAIVVSKGHKYSFHIYYLTEKNTLYRQTVESIPVSAFDKAVARAKELNSLIHHRNPSERPPSHAFALEVGYMDLPMDKFDEKVSIGLPISSVPGIHLTFDTQVIGKPEPGLLTRFKERSAGALPLLKNFLASSSVIRKGARKVAGLNFEELLIKTTTEGRNVYAFRLEFPGTPELSLEPYTVLELSTVDGGPGFESDEQAVKFWDDVVESLQRI